MLVSSVPLSETILAGRAADRDESIELTHDAQPRQRGVGDQRQAFPGEVVDDRQYAEPLAISECIPQEVQAPALI
jgi:hypothetical protein